MAFCHAGLPKHCLLHWHFLAVSPFVEPTSPSYGWPKREASSRQHLRWNAPAGDSVRDLFGDGEFTWPFLRGCWWPPTFGDEKNHALNHLAPEKKHIFEHISSREDMRKAISFFSAFFASKLSRVPRNATKKSKREVCAVEGQGKLKQIEW